MNSFTDITLMMRICAEILLPSNTMQIQSHSTTWAHTKTSGHLKLISNKHLKKQNLCYHSVAGEDLRGNTRKHYANPDPLLPPEPLSIKLETEA
ncbi:hypothetical protein CEXT_519151 [Caerostris extrusa]|uniref:Uncharacterized protein n=1 Tax=Caerostris extrusa TaxID=172846 RepID=A0AAV4RHH7_CAEEX|nr:hypothetical protein CEXT_519151 [Caerostris extrusa]